MEDEWVDQKERRARVMGGVKRRKGPARATTRGGPLGCISDLSGK